MSKQSIKIAEPVLERDFESALELVEANLFKYDLSLDELKSAALGEILVAKKANKVIGMLNMRYPGKIFTEMADDYFCLSRVTCPKSKIGYIALISIDQEFQGQGVGKKMIKKAVTQQKKWGAEAIVVHASQNSPGNGSEKLFASFGFIPTHLHKAPWLEYSKEKGPTKFWCHFCGNPCKCDQLEMVLDLCKVNKPSLEDRGTHSEVVPTIL